MKTRLKLVAFVLLALATLNSQLSTARAQGTAFTYQGRLNSGGSPASGSYNLTFALFATNSGGTAIAGSVTNNAVSVTNGLFTVQIDFGSGVFTGLTNWLQIGVATNGVAAFTPLTPRQELTPVPNAIYAESAGGLSGPLSAADLTSIGNSSGGAGNFFVGPSGNSTMSGGYNTADGAGALNNNASGSFNTAIGYSALFFNNNGYDDIAVGGSALFNNTSGSDNVAAGKEALYGNTSGNDNTAYGYQALYSNTNGNNNVAAGWSALANNTSGSFNVANGYAALLNNTTGDNNAASGYFALQANTIGQFNTADGGLGLYKNTIGNNNVANGYSALYANINGGQNTANGAVALENNISGSFNVGNGYAALFSNQTGAANTANGYQALFNNVTGNNNVADGVNALYASTNGSENTAVGYGALQNSTNDSDLVAVGFQALENDTAFNLGNTSDGNSHNTALGYQALQFNSIGVENTAAGYQTLNKNTSGWGNLAVGTWALAANSSGSYNVALGFDALFNITNSGNNIAVGQAAGLNFTGNESYNIDIGSLGIQGESGVIRIGDSFYQSTTYIAGQVGLGGATPQQTLSINGGMDLDQANLNSGTVADALTFGAGSGEGIGSTRVSGHTDTDGLNFYTGFAKRLTILNNGNVGIGTANPAYLVEADSGGAAKLTLDTSGNLECAGTVYSHGIALTSDRNAKENFKPVDNQTVLARLAALPVTQWNYKTDSKGVQHIGPMAQDFQAAFGLDGTDDKHISVVDEGGVALAAIQGLNEKVEGRNQSSEARLQRLEAQNEELNRQLDELKALVKLLAQK